MKLLRLEKIQEIVAKIKEVDNMMILEFLESYGLDILIMAVAIVSVLYLYYNGKKDYLRKVVLNLVREAEDLLGRKTGELKYAYVVNEVYRRLPKILTVFITKEFLNNLIEDGVYKLKDYIDNGYLDQSYKETEVDIAKEE